MIYQQISYPISCFDKGPRKADTEWTEYRDNGVVASIVWIELNQTNQISRLDVQPTSTTRCYILLFY